MRRPLNRVYSSANDSLPKVRLAFGNNAPFANSSTGQRSAGLDRAERIAVYCGEANSGLVACTSACEGEKAPFAFAICTRSDDRLDGRTDGGWAGAGADTGCAGLLQALARWQAISGHAARRSKMKRFETRNDDIRVA